MNLKEQMSNDIAGIILQKIREKKGRVSIISDESRINRKHFNVKDFTRMPLYQLTRIFYCLALFLPIGEFIVLIDEIRKTILKYKQDYDFDMLDQ